VLLNEGSDFRTVRSQKCQYNVLFKIKLSFLCRKLRAEMFFLLDINDKIYQYIFTDLRDSYSDLS